MKKQMKNSIILFWYVTKAEMTPSSLIVSINVHNSYIIPALSL